MEYIAGDIIKEKNTKFKGTGNLDFHLSPRPVLLPIDFSMDDDFIYYFTMGSDLSYYAREPERYEILKKENGLKKPSLLDLKYVYKRRKSMKSVETTLREDDLKRLIQKHIEYEGLCKDEDCLELHEKF